MTSPLTLHTGSRRKHAPQLPFVGDLTLTGARVHEFCGMARRSLALMLAHRLSGPVFWITPAWTAERLHAQGMQAFVDPGRLTFMTPKRPEDVLWVMEETLRAGIVPLVVADIPAPPALTPIRRLHLAAETGAKLTHNPILGVVLTPDAQGAPGVESRWQMHSAHEGDRSGWHLRCLRHRTDPPKEWHIRHGAGGFALTKPSQAA